MLRTPLKVSEMKERSDQDRFEILRRLALAGAGKEDPAETTQLALSLATELVGLDASSLILWNEDFTVTRSVSHSIAPESQALLEQHEMDLIADLRRRRQLVSAYMSFAGENPYHAFTHPISVGGEVHGAVIGLQLGERTIVAEDHLLEALAAMLSLSYSSAGQIKTGEAPSPEDLDPETRDALILKGIKQTAVTVNHSVNNALMALSGRLGMMLENSDNLTEEQVSWLKAIHQSANCIEEVTRGLLQIDKVDTVEYGDGTLMQRLPRPDDSEC